MSVPIPLRDDFDAAAVRLAAKASKDAAQTRRLQALAEIYDEGTRNDAARVGRVGLQSVRDWVLAFNVEGLAGLIDGKASGQPCKLKALLKVGTGCGSKFWAAWRGGDDGRATRPPAAWAI